MLVLKQALSAHVHHTCLTAQTSVRDTFQAEVTDPGREGDMSCQDAGELLTVGPQDLRTTARHLDLGRDTIADESCNEHGSE